MKFSHFILIFLFVLFSNLLQAQIFGEGLDLKDSTQIQLLETHRGDQIVGQVEAIISKQVQFLSQNGQLFTYRMEEIKQISVYRPKEEVPPYIAYQRLFYSQTAFSYNQFEGDYKNHTAAFNNFDIGLSENFSLGAGIGIPYFGIARGKLNVSLSPSVHIGVGGNAFLPFVSFSDANYFHYYGIFTLGTPRAFLNFTIGRGIGALRDEFSELQGVIITIGGNSPLSKTWDLSIDSIILPTRHFTGHFTTIQFIKRKEKKLVGLGVGILQFIPIPLLTYIKTF